MEGSFKFTVNFLAAVIWTDKLTTLIDPSLSEIDQQLHAAGHDLLGADGSAELDSRLFQLLQDANLLE